MKKLSPKKKGGYIYTNSVSNTLLIIVTTVLKTIFENLEIFINHSRGDKFLNNISNSTPFFIIF